MDLSIIGSYYAPRLEKLGFDLYKLITYIPFRLETISPFLNEEASSYFISGTIGAILNKGKHSTVEIITKHNKTVILYDFAKKTTYFKSIHGTQYQILFIKNNNYLTIVDIAQKSGIESETFELGKLSNKIYYRPVYSQLNYQIRSKQINKIITSLPSHLFKLNLIGLVPENNLIPQLLDLENIHKPTSLESFNQGINSWNNFQAYLNLVFLSNLNQTIITKETLITKLDKTLIDEYQEKLNIKLSNSQTLAINKILSNITY